MTLSADADSEPVDATVDAEDMRLQRMVQGRLAGAGQSAGGWLECSSSAGTRMANSIPSPGDGRRHMDPAADSASRAALSKRT